MYLKTPHCLLILLTLFNTLGALTPLDGCWAKLNKDGSYRTIFYFYPYHEFYFAKIIAIFDEKGHLLETMLSNNKSKAEGIINKPPIVGLDIVWGLKKGKSKYTDGHIVNPEEGSVYNVEAWIQEDRILKLRGKLLIFWKDISLKRVESAELQALGIKEPDATYTIINLPQL